MTSRQGRAVRTGLGDTEYVSYPTHTNFPGTTQERLTHCPHAARSVPPPRHNRRPCRPPRAGRLRQQQQQRQPVASLGTTPTNGSTADTVAPADTQEALLAFAACMRENGVDMEDPTFDADGNVAGGGIGPDSGVDMRSDEARAAMDVCGDLVQNAQFGGGPGGGLDRDAIQTAMNDYTACLRDEGVDVDDITMGGPGGGAPGGGVPTPGDGSLPPGGFGGPAGGSLPDGAAPGGDGFDPTTRMIEQLGLDETDPTVTAALATCQPILDGAFTTTTAG